VGNGTFLSGSVDQTTKLWDFRTASSVGHFGKHHSPVSFVGSSVIDGTWHAITGGEDHVVRVWDLRMARPLFETHVGAGVPISADLTRTELGRTLNVLTKEKDSTCAEGFQVPRATEAPQLFESCSNLWIRFLVENPDIAPS
jgi:WD40 repeat protein